MPRTRLSVFSFSLLALGSMAAWGRAAQPAKPTPTPTSKPSPTPAASATPRVFTNDDLEAAKKKGGGVQDLRATGVEPYEPPEPLQDPQPLPDAQPTPEPDPQAERIAYLESQIKILDDAAKQLLWGYLGSTDTNEILRLKSQQQEILTQIDALKAELAELRGQSTGRPAGAATPTPTPQPG